MRGVREATVNPFTNCVLVTYDPHGQESLRSGEFGKVSLCDAVHELLGGRSSSAVSHLAPCRLNAS